MTMSLTLVNTSNWDNEDYEVTDRHGDVTIIKPGESVIVYPSEDEPTVKAIPYHDNKEPFHMNGKQVWPVVSVGFKGS